MERRILEYRKCIDELLLKPEADWQKIMEEHLVQIGFFQHERFIHLIVTVLFAIMECFALGMTTAFFQIPWFLLTVIILVLLIPYVRHYYILENEVQKMYGQYDKLLEKLGKKETRF